MFIGNKASDVLCIKMVARYKDIYLCGNQTCWPRVYSGNFVICLFLMGDDCGILICWNLLILENICLCMCLLYCVLLFCQVES